MTVERPRKVVPGSGRKGDSRQLDQLISVRADPPLVAELRELAAADGVSAGEWVRRAIRSAAFERSLPPQVPGYRHAGWKCDHVSLAGGSAYVRLGPASCGQGCEMLPLYEVAA